MATRSHFEDHWGPGPAQACVAAFIQKNNHSNILNWPLMPTSYVTDILARQTLGRIHARRATAWTTRPAHATSGGKCAARAPSVAARAVPPRNEQMG